MCLICWIVGVHCAMSNRRPSRNPAPPYFYHHAPPPTPAHSISRPAPTLPRTGVSIGVAPRLMAQKQRGPSVPDFRASSAPFSSPADGSHALLSQTSLDVI